MPTQATIAARRADAVHRLDGAERLIVLRADRGTGAASFVRAWTRRPDVAAANLIAWPQPDDAPTAGVCQWQRAITRLHSVGAIDDALLHRVLAAAAESGADALALLTREGRRPLVVVVDRRSTADVAGAEGLAFDVDDLLDRTEQLRLIVLTARPTELERAPALARFGRLVLDVEDIRRWRSAVAVDGAAATPALTRTHLEALDPADAAFVRATAAAPFLDAKLAAALTDGTSAGQLLDAFAAEGLGEWRSAPNGRVFHYHEVVREWGCGSVDEESGPPLAPADAATISRWLLERGEPASALSFALRSGDTDLVVAAGIRAFPFGAETPGVQADLVRRLPQLERLSQPLLALWSGAQLAMHPHGMVRAEDYFVAVNAGDNARGRALPPTERVLLVAMQAYVLRRTGQAVASRAKALSAYRKAAELVRKGRVDPALHQAFVSALYQLGVSLVYAREENDARELFTLLYGFCEENGLGHRRNSAIAALAFLAAENGSTAEAERWLELVVDEDWPSFWPTGHARAYHDLARTLIALNRTDLPSLEARLADLAPHVPELEHWDVVVRAQVAAKLLRGDVIAASAWFDECVRMRLVASTHPRVRENLRALALLLEAAGRAPHERVPLTGPAREASIGSALRAVVAARAGNAEQAVAQVISATRTARTPLEQSLATVASILVARHGDHRIDLADARAKLQVIAEIHGTWFPLILLSPADREAVVADPVDGPEASGTLRSILDRLPARGALDDAGAARRPLLTRQEQAALRVLSDHESRIEIAQRLHLSVNTVKVHLRSVYRKLGVHSRAEALVAASLLGLISDEP